MPATITHAYFAQDVVETLDLSIKNKVDINKIRMFGQSTDPLMFYNIVNLKPGKEVRKFQKTFHTSNTRLFFLNTINYIKDNKLDNDKNVMSFLYGFICHYVLDSTVHPFIIYKTGYFNKRKKETFKYNNIHSFMECFIDMDMVKRREKTNPYKFKFDKFCFCLEPFSDNLNGVINYSFLTTYNFKNADKIYYKSLKQMRLFLNVFRRDPYGIKKNLYKFIDTFTKQNTFRMEAISYHYNLDDKHNFLNSNHNIWHNPVKYDIVSRESFIELYLKSIKTAKKIIEEVDKYFKGDNVDLCNIFLNLNYLTGLDCDLEKDIRYFEF